jgi:hypothetical protein
LGFGGVKRLFVHGLHGFTDFTEDFTEKAFSNREDREAREENSKTVQEFKS